MHDARHGGFSLTSKGILILLAAYYVLNFVLRTFVSDSLQLDEAEQLIVTQEWRWGYGSQPPLYNWLQKLVFLALGPSVLSLALLKNLLLYGIVVFTFLTAREVFGPGSDAGDSALALMLIPGLVWESQRDQTHLVLATLLSVATFYLFLRMTRSRQAWLFATCGAVAGLGVLAKYNFALVLAALFVAAGSLRNIRGAFNVRNGLWFLAGFLTVTFAHFWWMYSQWELVLTQSESFEQQLESPLNATLLGVGQVLLRIVEYGAVPVLIFAGYRLTAARRKTGELANPAGLELLRRSVLVGLALVLVIVVVFQVTKVKARWLQPMLIVLPILLVGAARPYLTVAGRFRLLALVCAVLVAVPALLYGRVVALRREGRPSNLNLPYPAWAAQIRNSGFRRGNILAADKAVAGNLKLQFPESPVLTPEFTDVELLPGGPVLLAWRPADSPDARAEAQSFAEKLLGDGIELPPSNQVEAPALYDTATTLSLGFVLIEAAAVVQPPKHADIRVTNSSAGQIAP